ncbi:hypothetical protein QZH41_000245 [Actinostola sp. cb2023]|nr:hypothetical protein QZH41_000245 [Actinostola sp. cb2023]
MLIAKQLGVTTFKGTEGWFSKWKQRHNIAQFNIAGEEGVSEDTVESWSERVKELTKGYAAADIWNEDETGTFWKALPIKSLSEKGKRCRGGKNAKQRITAAFFVSADGGKESVVLIGSSKKPRCFANLVDISRPCGAHYFSNAKAWMKTEIMENVISKLNGKMKRENRNIKLFLDNAPCHSPSLKGKFSNIQIEFLPKNTTSRTQPLDAGIIKTWKTYYRRKLLRYVAGQMDGEKTVSEIVKSVNLLMAVRWVVSAWKEVPAAVISKCFKKVGMYPDENLSAEEDDDPFESEELMDIPQLLSHISPGLDMSAFDDEADAFERPIDTTHPNWREVVRQEIIAASTNEEQVYEISNDDEDYDQPLQLPEVTSAEQAMELVGRLAAFSDWQGNEPLAQAITKEEFPDAKKDLFGAGFEERLKTRAETIKTLVTAAKVGHQPFQKKLPEWQGDASFRGRGFRNLRGANMKDPTDPGAEGFNHGDTSRVSPKPPSSKKWTVDSVDKQ